MGAEALMDAKLVIVGGKANKAEISLRLPAVIGRSRDADLTMAHPMVSRQHCKLYEDNGLVKIRDLGSLNGTIVGSHRVREADLYPDSEFTVGPLTFRVQYDYVGEIATAPDTVPENEPSDVPEAELAEDALELADVDQEPASEGPASEPLVEVVPEADEPMGIVPSDGQLSDLGPWAEANNGQAGAGLFEGPPSSFPGPAEIHSEEGTERQEQAAAETGEADESGLPVPPLIARPPDGALASEEEPAVQLDLSDATGSEPPGPGNAAEPGEEQGSGQRRSTAEAAGDSADNEQRPSAADGESPA